MNTLLNEDQLKKDMKFWNIPGLSVGVIRDGEIIFQNGYGLRNIASDLPMTHDTLGGIASCSKSFTSAVIASLVDEGKLGFDTPVMEYIPGFRLMDPVAGSEVTVRDMLYHRTGLANHDAMWPDPSITQHSSIWMQGVYASFVSMQDEPKPRRCRRCRSVKIYSSPRSSTNESMTASGLASRIS